MAGNRRDLYLQVGGDIRGLQTAMTAGKTIINEFGGSAINVIEEVEKEMAKLGSSGLPNLKQVENAYTASFKRISDSAREVANAPSGAAAVQILNANATREAAAAATNKAASLRLLAEAAQRADVATEGGSAAQRAYAVATATAAVNAEREAEALREQAIVLNAVERQLDTSSTATRRNVAISGQARAGYQQLSYNLGDIATQYSAGTAASIIFAQQSGQVVQAIGLINGEAKGLIGFLGGPWGIAITAGLVALTPWVAKLLEGNDVLGDAVDKLKKEAEQSELTRRAHVAFSQTIEGQIDAQRRLNDEMERSIKTQRQIQQEKLRDAQSTLAGTRDSRVTVAGQISRQQARVNDLQNQIANPGPGVEPESITAIIILAAKAEKELARLKAQLATIDVQIANGTRAVNAAQQPLLEAGVAAELDKRTAAALRYEIALGRLRQQQAIGQGRSESRLVQGADGSFKRENLPGISDANFRAQLKKITQERDAAIKAAQESTNKPPSLGAQLTTERSASLLSSAQRYKGLSETGDNDALQSLFQQAGMNVDPKMTAWCAAFVNAVLATNGLPGTNSLSARSFQNYGTATDRPVAGDIVVARRGTGNQGHVGFYQGTDAKGNIQVFGGNTADQVGTQTIARKDVLGFRRAPTAGAAARTAEQLEEEQVRNQDAYASLVSKAKDEQLRLERSRVLTISEAADLDVQAVSLARADIDRALEKGVELKRWTQAEAEAAKMITAGNELTAVQMIRERERVQTAQRALELEGEVLSDKLDQLRLDADLATTAADRRAIARQMLKIEQDEVRIALEGQLNKATDPDDRAAIQRKIADQPAINAKEEQRLARQNADPLQSYGQRLIDATADMDEAFKGVKADGLEALEDGLVGVIDGTESAAGAFKNMAASIMADLARIAVRKLFVQAIGSSFFGLKDGGLVDGFADGGIPGFAAGGAQRSRGRISGPGTARSDSILAMLGGREPIRLSDGEFVVNAASTARYLPLIEAINENRIPGFAEGGLVAPTSFPRLPSIAAAETALGSRNDRLALDVSVKTEASPLLISTVEQTSLRTVAASAEPIMAGAEYRTMKRLRRRSLPGGYAG
jgi:uncharacterized protein (TIGR02594 family)